MTKFVRPSLKLAFRLILTLSTLHFTPAHGIEYVDRAARVDSIVELQGEHHFSLRPTDMPIGNRARVQRAEKMPPLAKPRRWYHYTWETRLPADTPTIVQDVLVMQWRNRLGAPRTSIHLDRGEWQLRINRPNRPPLSYRFKADVSRWMRWDMYVYWSAGQKGYLRLVAGDTVIEFRGPNIWAGAIINGKRHPIEPPHWSFGLYRPQWVDGQLVRSDEPALREIALRNYDYSEL